MWNFRSHVQGCTPSSKLFNWGSCNCWSSDQCYNKLHLSLPFASWSGETDVHLHADNCAGQNKNNYFLWYLVWRTATELHCYINYSFLIAGHTKFGQDRCFGILKKSFKVSFISSLYELARMVETSSNTGVKKAQLVATHNGRVIVPVYDWSTFLGQYFKKLLNIKKFHHFRFSKDEPGVVYCREFLSSPEQAFFC